jgi:hypothetical protein
MIILEILTIFDRFLSKIDEMKLKYLKYNFVKTK